MCPHHLDFFNAILYVSVRSVLFNATSQLDHVEIVIADTGRGIHPEDLPKIFNPFFSTKGVYASATRGQPDIAGTGLGLATCESCIHRHHGTIQVESMLGHGATFRIRLPLAHREEIQVPHLQSGLPVPELAQSLKQRRILVIDDNEMLRDIIVVMLQEAGAEVEACSSGLEGIAAVQRTCPDVILVDWLMPAMSGEHFIEQLSHLSVAQQSALIVMSGDLTQCKSDVLSFSRLAKPFTTTSLLEVVAKSLNKN